MNITTVTEDLIGQRVEVTTSAYRFTGTLSSFTATSVDLENVEMRKPEDAHFPDFVRELDGTSLGLFAIRSMATVA